MPTSSNELFPSSPREIYEKAPLIQVVCQLRFPPVLRIESQIPADFQERIRARFPLFERNSPPLAAPLPIPAFPGAVDTGFLAAIKHRSPQFH